MKDSLKERIEKAGIEMDEQFEMLPKIDVGSEEETIAMKNAETRADIYCKLLKTYDEMEKSEEEIKERKKNNVREWVKTVSTVVLSIVTSVAGIVALRTIGVQEAIDEANGDISSMSVRTQKQLARGIVKDLIFGKGIR